jgi:hypothetical protein
MQIVLQVEILIIMGILLFILFSHLLYSCCYNPWKTAHNFIYGFNEVMNKKIINHILNPVGASVPYGAVEGFTGANLNENQSAPFSTTANDPVNTNNWGLANLTWTEGQPMSPIVQEVMNRPNQIPKPQELDYFKDTQFKPECCGNAGSSYSTGSGCACMSVPQYNYLVNRGGNNVPYSEY